jgi:hypothetical protein
MSTEPAAIPNTDVKTSSAAVMTRRARRLMCILIPLASAHHDPRPVRACSDYVGLAMACLPIDASPSVCIELVKPVARNDFPRLRVTPRRRCCRPALLVGSAPLRSPSRTVAVRAASPAAQTVGYCGGAYEQFIECVRLTQAPTEPRSSASTSLARSLGRHMTRPRTEPHVVPIRGGHRRPGAMRHVVARRQHGRRYRAGSPARAPRWHGSRAECCWRGMSACHRASVRTRAPRRTARPVQQRRTAPHGVSLTTPAQA